MRKLFMIVGIFLAATLTACESLSDAADRYLGTDTSLVEAALLADAVRSANPDIELREFEDRLLAYRLIDIAGAKRRGEVTDDEARAQALNVLRELADES